MGDPAGIGPEVALRAALHPEVMRAGQVVLVGERAVWERAAAGLKLAATFRAVRRGAPSPGTNAPSDPSIPPLRGEAELCIEEPDGAAGASSPPGSRQVVRLGAASAAGGRAAAAAIEHATRLCLAGEADAIVTAPICKESLQLAGLPHPGHTEMLRDLCGAPDVMMMLVGGGLRVALATIHLPLAAVPAAITRDLLESKFALLAREFGRLRLADRPRVAVCGLNPHAGEAGMFGREEIDTIAPAVAAARTAHPAIDWAGPLPADTLFHRAIRGDFDVVVAMYHDQGLGPLKTVAFADGVNVSLGLPVVRTSPDHGTAFDIAGRGVADPGSMIAAALVAARMAAGEFPPARPMGMA
jgi:4-hydroxythreonine-4-phosphate dehydrogenase